MGASRGGSMDQENLALQERLHKANQERMTSFEAEQRRMNETLIRIDENTKALPDVLRRLGNLETDKGKIKGAMWVIGVLWGAVLGVGEFLLRKG